MPPRPFGAAERPDAVDQQARHPGPLDGDRHGFWPSAPDVGAKRLVADGRHLNDRAAAEHEAINRVSIGQQCREINRRAAEWHDVGGLVARLPDQRQDSASYQREVMWIGITGWTFRISCVPL